MTTGSVSIRASDSSYFISFHYGSSSVEDLTSCTKDIISF